MEINKSIRNLRVSAFLLFFVPFIGLVGSLIFHNFLISLGNYSNENFIYPIEEFKIGNKVFIECSEENNWCNWKKNNKFYQCKKYLVTKKYFDVDSSEILDRKIWQKITSDRKKTSIEIEVINTKNENCILNSKYYIIYKIFPQTFEKVYYKASTFSLGTSKAVNPIIYGETSISNIVKRYPINYVFKPLLFLASLIMITYWFYYNKIFNFLFEEKNIRIFYIFGILSAIFLFLHVFFLGSIYESKILTQLRRSYIIFFILFEILAQVFLIKNILYKRNQLLNYLKDNIITCKLFFVSFVCLSTLIILLILIFHNLSSNIDYILEWNYFLILIIFYFLSFLMWKKN